MPKNSLFGKNKLKVTEAIKESNVKSDDKIKASSLKPKLQKLSREVKRVILSEKSKVPKDIKENKIKISVRFLDILSDKAIKDNSVLFRILAICTVLGAATTLKNGLLLSAMTAVVTIALYFIMALLFKNVPIFIYYALALLIAGAIVTPLIMLANFCAPNVASSCSYFLPITAINAILMIDTRVTKGERQILRSIAAGIGDVLGFSVVIIIFAALREVIGSGMLYGRIIPDYTQFRFNFVLLPPGAFLLLGLLLALVQGIKLHAENHKNDKGAR